LPEYSLNTLLKVTVSPLFLLIQIDRHTDSIASAATIWNLSEVVSGMLRHGALPDLGRLAVLAMEVTAVKNLIEIMAKALVEHPDQVNVSEIAGEHASVIELRTAKEDLGKIIGKRGRNAQAMRTILNAASAKLRKRTVLEIIEGDDR
jgi:predicted RNA-binding protein YlqC (UPF0109 family)